MRSSPFQAAAADAMATNSPPRLALRRRYVIFAAHNVCVLCTKCCSAEHDVFGSKRIYVLEASVDEAKYSKFIANRLDDGNVISGAIWAAAFNLQLHHRRKGPSPCKRCKQFKFKWIRCDFNMQLFVAVGLPLLATVMGLVIPEDNNFGVVYHQAGCGCEQQTPVFPVETVRLSPEQANAKTSLTQSVLPSSPEAKISIDLRIQLPKQPEKKPEESNVYNLFFPQAPCEVVNPQYNYHTPAPVQPIFFAVDPVPFIREGIILLYFFKIKHNNCLHPFPYRCGCTSSRMPMPSLSTTTVGCFTRLSSSWSARANQSQA